MKTILINKLLCITPLQAIRRLQSLNPELEGEKIGYAGRLDPMAEGLLLLLIGDENKKRKEYEQLPKTYDFEVLLGIETDSYDVLGLIQRVTNASNLHDIDKKIKSILLSYIGSWEQPYPPYSAARVKGKSLYYWAREGKIDQVTIPRKKISISSLELNKVTTVNLSDIFPDIVTRIQSVDGEFRQKEILSRWEEIITNNPNLKLIKLTLMISCSSGTYVRGIAHQIGQKLGVGGIAYTIKRIKVGPYKLVDALMI